MSALEDSLRKVYKLPTMPAGSSMDSGFDISLPPMTPEQQAMAKRMGKQFSVTPENMQPMTPEQKEYMQRMSVSPTDMMQRGQVSEQELDMMVDDVAKDMNEEEKQILEAMLERGLAIQESPLAAEVQKLKQYGEGGDTELAHLQPGEMVIPPEFLEDEQFESALAKKFDEFDINPEQAIVGSGIASLNPVTGLEQFFFKKIGKALKKVAKKIAPIAGPLANFIPGVGPVLAGAIGAATNVAAGEGLKGAVSGALGGYGAGKLFSGVGSLGTVGGKAVGQGGFSQLGGLDKFRALGSGLKSGKLTSTFFNPATGDTGIFGGKLGPSIRRGLGSLTGLGQTPGQQTYDTGNVIGTLDGEPVTRADLANMTPDQIGNIQMTQAAVNDKTLMQRLSAKFLPQGVENVLGTGPSGGGIFGGGQGQGGGGGLFGGGFGDALKMGGIGALAAGLGKLAYEDAKKQKGVALTPLTTMSPTGRYNIEAEIARRTGQATPNPVEFGLLPSGTLPELSGGKPRGMMYGGGIMAYAQGGAVQMQEGGEMDPSMFPRMDGDINGPGTETSDDIPAMLSDGEFVMTGQAVRGAGSYEMQADPNGIISLVPSLEENRERGMNLMYKMMDTFASQAKVS
tara:strand:- start:320 stop:2191 length:1872 start_codon:yes stop_codon:yes gene_type:complete